MACDYALIRADNQREYGAGVGRWGQDLLTNRYDDRTHFIFELLQNAEDALARRKEWQGSRAVRFTLSATELRIVHCGQPFDVSNVRGICGIGDSTKDLTAVGRFGIGFKSVYAFTHRPEVHSGPEDFAIESFVWPSAISAIDRRADETVFILPLAAEDAGAHGEIAGGLRRLGARTLLFLRHIEEIAWSVEGGPSGLYVRGKPEEIGRNVHRIILLGEEHGKPDVEETWLLFSREARTPEGVVAGRIEIAFSVTQEKKSGRWLVQVASDSNLVVFFPTIVETHLGFLVQGPYRTTPSRDNVPRNDPWNQHLVQESAKLLVEALRSLRAQGLLDVDALRSLPLDPTKFAEGRMFAPLFAAVREALRTEPLLPAFRAGHTTAATAMLARTQELRELFTPRQLASVFGVDGEMVWLSADITQDRTSELRQYLIGELDIVEATPEAILPKLNQSFLEQQSDEWTCRFFEFLNGQPALIRQGRLKDIPLVRLEDGSHVTPTKDGRPQAFLPSPIATDFPTVRSMTCYTEGARALLLALGLTKPDPVDDVVWNVLPKYRADEFDVSNADYEADIRRITTAFGTDSMGQKEKLLGELRKTAFVRAVDSGDGRGLMSKPSSVYVATDRLKKLFDGVPDVLLVDDTHACLRGEDIREMLEGCGALRYLRPIEDCSLSSEERSDLRALTGHGETSGQNDRITDWTLGGLKNLLTRLPSLEITQRGERAKLLWEELAHLEERRGKGAFSGEYTWTHYGSYRAAFDAAFVRQLNDTAWVPGANGDLQHPGLLPFETLGWKPNPFLLSMIRFKPAIIDQLAKEAGIEPGVLDLLRKLGVTSVADLHRLGIKDQQGTPDPSAPGNVDDALKMLLGNVPAPTPPVVDPANAEPSWSGTGRAENDSGTDTGSGRGKDPSDHCDGQPGGRTKGVETGSSRRTPGGASGRPFISYVAVQPDEEGRDPDGLDQEARMALEAQAINLILAREPKWQRTHTHNPGYDLFEPSGHTTPAQRCEVKAMTGTLRDRPVGLTRTQFECAREHGEGYWLYVVERADAIDARIVRIRDPAGKARSFTFDRGWLEIADVDAEQEYRED